MIRNDEECGEAAILLRQEKDRLAKRQSELRSTGLSPAQIKRALDPLRSFRQQLVEEVRAYRRRRARSVRAKVE